MFTPWGPSQTTARLAPGIVEVTTASHGGIHCTPQANATIPEALRLDDGWYEEDVDILRVYAAHPELSSVPDEQVRERLAEWLPDAYEAWTGQQVTATQSFIVAGREFFAAHAEDLVTTAAWGSWHDQVPDRMVMVATSVGGDRTRPGPAFLVPEDEYGARGAHGMVVDPARHRQVPEADI